MSSKKSTSLKVVGGGSLKTSAMTVGFGVPNNPGQHRFVLTIPRGSKHDDQIEVTEIFSGDASGPESIVRVKVNRKAWMRIRQQLQHYLNTRLKSKGLKASKFKTGENPIDRFLGREVCLLLWGVECAGKDMDVVDAVHHNWMSYTPEEMWWMFQQVVKAEGHWDSPIRGWRRAIQDVLSAAPVSGGEVAQKRSKKPVEVSAPPIDSRNLELFDHSEQSDTETP